MTPIVQHITLAGGLCYSCSDYGQKEDIETSATVDKKKKKKKKGPKQVQKIENTVKATSPQYTKAEITGQSTLHENAANRPTPLMRDDRREILKEYI